MKSFTYSGKWWLPAQEDHKVAGEAIFSGSDQTELVLQDTFIHDLPLGAVELSWYPIILGRTEAGQPLTLLHCQQTRFHISIGEGEEKRRQEYNAEVALIGTHFTDPQQILFTKVDIYYSYLPQWAGVFLRYPKVIDEIKAITAKGTVVVQSVKTGQIPGVDLSETMLMRCEVIQALPLTEWVRQFIVPLQHLISLATQRPNAIVNIVGYVQQSKADQSIDVPVQIAFPPAIIPIPTSKSTVPRTILFSLQEIADNFSSVIDTWLRLADELDSVYSLFFGVQYTNLLLDLKFLLLAQTVEVYQDNRFQKAAFSDEAYQRLMDTLLAACPDEEKRAWVANALEYSNHATFRQQLKDLVSKTNDVLKPFLGSNSKNKNNLVEVIYNTRNYLTHHTKNLVANAAVGIELLYITHCLSLALQLCLMQELGFTTERLTKLVRRHESHELLSALHPRIDLEKLVRRTN